MAINLDIVSCLRYCKSTIFQANHNERTNGLDAQKVVCDTAKVRFFKQITTTIPASVREVGLFAILQKYDFSSKSQQDVGECGCYLPLFAILQKYDFSSKSQLRGRCAGICTVVCDTAKVRFFKQITTQLKVTIQR